MSATVVRVKNPILPGFHPDPSFCVANGEYFVANSTFEWYPGVEISRSKDLVHWTSVPSPLSEKRLLDMSGEKFSCGIWAPCLSYSDGLFYLIFTNVRNWNVGPMKDVPNFLTTAPSIEGPWSDPIFLDASGFDPSLFHDDDGRHWYIHPEWDYRAFGPHQFSGLILREYLPEKKCFTGERKKVFLGTDIGMVEGPHIYKRNGWYYILAAEGGTSYEHALTVARSRNVDGPYEVHPSNPLLSTYGHDEAPLKKAGHGSWVTSVDGKKTYLAYLCGRPLPGTKLCPLGRETGLAEIQWKDDWPYVVQANGTLGCIPPAEINVEVESDAEKTQCSPGGEAVRYDFKDDSYRSDFKSLRVPMGEDRCSIRKNPGVLILKGGQSPWSFYEQSVLARRQMHFCFRAETKIDFEPDYFQQYAGLTYRYDEESQYLLQVGYDEKLGKVLQLNTILPDIPFFFKPGVAIPIKEGPVWLRLDVEYSKAVFSWSQDGKNYRMIRPLCDASKLSDDYSDMGFTGAFVGMFCVDTEFYQKEAKFHWFDYIPKE